MPLPIQQAHRLAERLAYVRKNGDLDYLRPDAKTQVSVRYRDGKPVSIDKLLISTQHSEAYSDQSAIKSDLWEHVVKHVLPQDLYDENTLYKEFLVNPTGRFVIGGPVGDCGLTGRKIIVDTYGGAARHGGGAFSGKDSSKVDRSAAYATRWVAKNIVAAGLAERAELQVATPSASPSRSRSWSRRSAPRRSTARRSRRPSARSSTSARWPTAAS